MGNINIEVTSRDLINNIFTVKFTSLDGSTLNIKSVSINDGDPVNITNNTYKYKCNKFMLFGSKTNDANGIYKFNSAEGNYELKNSKGIILYSCAKNKDNDKDNDNDNGQWEIKDHKSDVPTVIHKNTQTTFKNNTIPPFRFVSNSVNTEENVPYICWLFDNIKVIYEDNTTEDVTTVDVTEEFVSSIFGSSSSQDNLQNKITFENKMAYFNNIDDDDVCLYLANRKYAFFNLSGQYTSSENPVISFSLEKIWNFLNLGIEELMSSSSSSSQQNANQYQDYIIQQNFNFRLYEGSSCVELSKRLQFFPENFVVTLANKEDITYVQTINTDIKFDFDLKYKNSIIDKKIYFSKMQVDTSWFSSDLIDYDDALSSSSSSNSSSSSWQPDDYVYPQVWKTINENNGQNNLYNQNQMYIYYHQENENTKYYSFTLPYGYTTDNFSSISIQSSSDTMLSNAELLNDIVGDYSIVHYEDYRKLMNQISADILSQQEYYSTETNKIYIQNNSNSDIPKYLKYSKGNEKTILFITTNIAEQYPESNEIISETIIAYAQGDGNSGNYTFYKKNKSDNLIPLLSAKVNLIKRSISNGNVDSLINGYKRFFNVRLSDEFGNKTQVSVLKTQVYNTKPYDLSLKLIGSDGNEKYTGFYKKYGRFFPSDYITINFSANSMLNMTYEITGDIYGDKLTGKFDNKTFITKKVKLKINNSDESLLGLNRSANVTLTIIDSVGNKNQTTSQIQYVSTLFRTKNLNLAKESLDYKPTLRKIISGTYGNIINEKNISNQFVRSWNEIWFPQNHGSPLNPDGTINVTQALRIAQQQQDPEGKTGPTSKQLEMYDRLAWDSTEKKLLTDNDGRYVQSAVGWSQNKKYDNMINKTINNSSYETYWIIDNSGNNEFRLQFEYFDFDETITKIPANLVAPYDGDMLSVYDASDDQAVVETIDDNGNKKFALRDATKLTHLFTLKGSKSSIKMIDNRIGGQLQIVENGCITPNMSTYKRVCLIPFTDYQGTASGFKLKAGPKHYIEYKNYDLINEVGQVWMHDETKESFLSLGINYNYYQFMANIDYNDSTVSFEKRIEYPLIGTFNSYLHLDNENTIGFPHSYFDENHKITSFASTQDDMVDYINVVIKDDKETIDTNNYFINKDTGVLDFKTSTNSNSYRPTGRIFGDYAYHTYYRLTSDGYGDLFFYGSGILVPSASTTLYKDWTYVDLKIVNEGSVQITQGTISFLARGYITKGTVVDTVLDNNRPWDIQKGSVAETVQRMGAKSSFDYSELPAVDDIKGRENAYESRNSQTCNFGTLQPKQSVYVRVFWCIANNAKGTSWIECTKGPKVSSAQLSGKYFIFTI